MTQLDSPDETRKLLSSGLSELSNRSALHWLSVPAPELEAETLLDRAPEQDAWYWSHGADCEMAAVGVAARLKAEGATRFQSMDEQVSALFQRVESTAPRGVS